MNSLQKLEWYKKNEECAGAVGITIGFMSIWTYIVLGLSLIDAPIPVVFTVKNYENKICITGHYNEQNYCGVLSTSWKDDYGNSGTCFVQVSSRKQEKDLDEELLFSEQKEHIGFLRERKCQLGMDGVNYKKWAPIILISTILIDFITIAACVLWNNRVSDLTTEIRKSK